MLNPELAQKVKEAVSQVKRQPEKYYHVDCRHLRRSELFDQVTGTVIYVGCGYELSSFLVFPNVACYLHQDIEDPDLTYALKALEREGIITNLRVLTDELSKGVSEFDFLGKHRRLIEVRADIAGFVPPEAKKNLQAIYFLGMAYPDSIRAMQLNLLPHLALGGLFEGPYPYPDGTFEGAQPQDLGLEFQKGTFVKTRHLTQAEISQTIGFKLTDYQGWKR